jgi:hypothetical protein
MALLRSTEPYDPEKNRYPKWVYPEDGAPAFIVKDEAAHQEWLAGRAIPEETPPPAGERQKMIDLASANNVKIDKRWSDQRIAEALSVAGVEIK